MNDMGSVRWMLTFYHSEGGSRDEPDFPEVEFWHPSEKASMESGARVLRELKEQGDTRDWKAVGHPDPKKMSTEGDILFCVRGCDGRTNELG